MPKWPREVTIPLFHPREGKALRIVGEGAIAHPAAVEGKMVPVVILDTSERPDIDEFIRLHAHIAAGDAKTQWGTKAGDQDIVRLILTFLRPSELVAIIDFDLGENQGILVEGTLIARSLYIQGGREGDRIKNTMDRPKVIVEVPDTGFDSAWDKIYLKHAVAKMKAEGMPRANAKRAAREFVDLQRASLKFMRVPTE